MCPSLSGRMSRNASVSLSSWSMVAGACFWVILQNMQSVLCVVLVFTCLCLVLLLVRFLFCFVWLWWVLRSLVLGLFFGLCFCVGLLVEPVLDVILRGMIH